MTSSAYFLASEQFAQEVTKWFRAIIHGDSVSVLFAPKTDRFVRLGYLLNDQRMVSKALGPSQAKRTILQRVDFDAHDVEELDDLHQLIAAQVNTSNHFSERYSFSELTDHLKRDNLLLIVIIPEAEKFLNPEGKTVLTRLSYLAEGENEHIRVISFFEKNIMHPSVSANLPSSSHLYENVYHYPLYSDEQTRNFIRFLEKYWSSGEISRDDEDRIIETCGGHFWLVKEAVRSLTYSGSWTLDDEGTLFRLRTIYSSFLPSEQKVLQKVISGKKITAPDEQLSAGYFRTMNILTDKGKLKLGGLTHYLRHHAQFQGDLSLRNGKIMLNQIPIDGIFSRKELRIVRLLLTKKNRVVSRDDIATSLWPGDTSEQYSDWAIDQIIARIRKRLTELSIPSQVLESERGKGYRLHIV